MPRIVRETNITTRTARSKLAVAKKPYYRALDEGLHLGYRQSHSGGAWVVRFYDNGSYKIKNLSGRPDDVLDADGETVLNWTQAQAEARKFFQQQKRIAAGLEATPIQAKPYTVSDAIADYLVHLGRNGKTLKDTTYRTNGQIIPQLGMTEVAKLNPAKIRTWLDDLAAAPARLRLNAAEKKAGETKFKALDTTDPEAVRRRRSTANRVLTILKAALNHAWGEGKVTSDDGWRKVKPFREADSARIRYLNTDEAKRLLNTCESDFRGLVHAALTTGARFGELAALEVSDFNPDSGTVHIRKSKSGKARHIVLNDEGQRLFDSLCAGRPNFARIFIKADGTVWGKSHQQRPFKEACTRAKLTITFHELRHTWASLSIMAGMPLMVVAGNLGHSDTRMVEKHYGHLAQSFRADAIRASAPSFGLKSTNSVVPINRELA